MEYSACSTAFRWSLELIFTGFDVLMVGAKPVNIAPNSNGKWSNIQNTPTLNPRANPHLYLIQGVNDSCNFFAYHPQQNTLYK